MTQWTLNIIESSYISLSCLSTEKVFGYPNTCHVHKI